MSLGRIGLAPAFTAEAAEVAKSLDDFGLKYDRIHVVLTRVGQPAAAVDTTFSFNPASPNLDLDLRVQISTREAWYDALIEYRDATTVFFTAKVRVLARALNETAAPPTSLTLNYVGPGANATRLTIAPKTLSVPASRAMTLTATAFDKDGAVVQAPIAWSVSDGNAASITTGGSSASLLSKGRAGSVTVTARTPNRITDQANATLLPPIAKITVISGAGQTDKVGSLLPVPLVVEARASDNSLVVGAPIEFVVPTGATANPSIATTDASGRATTTVSLGRVAGEQTFSATADGASAAISETAKADVPFAIGVLSGDKQTAVVRRTLELPLTVKVTDRFDNAVPDVVVKWTTKNTGDVGASESTTDANGSAKITYKLGNVPGAETIVASIGNLNATFSATASAAKLAAVAAFSGGGQAGLPGATLPQPLVAKVTDIDGVAVEGVTVTWSATNGATFSAPTSVTDAQGLASVQVTLPTQITPVEAFAGVEGITATARFLLSANGGGGGGGGGGGNNGTGTRYVVTSAQSSVGAGSSVTITAQLIDAAGVAVSTSGQVASWSSSNGGSFSSPTSTTNSNGVATVTFTPSTVAGTAARVTATTASITGTSGNITTIAATPTRYLVTPATTTTVAGGSVSISAQLVDAYNNNVHTSGQLVTWSSNNGGSFSAPTSSTNANGVATVSFTTGAAGTLYVVSATTGTLTGQAAPIAATAANPTQYLVTPSAVAVPAGGSVTIFAQLAGPTGDPVKAANQVVSWSSTGGGSFASSTSSTDANGIAQVVFTTSGSPSPTNHVVTATTGGITGHSSTITTTGGGAPSAGVRYRVTPSANTVAAGATVTIAAQLVDANDLPVSQAGQVVSWSKTGTGGSFSSSTSTTDASGVATITFTTNSTAGPTYTFTATDGSSRTGTSAPVTTVGGTPTKYIVNLSTSTVTAGGTVVVTAQLSDASNNPVSVAGQTVTWSTTNGGSFASPTSTTNGGGTATVVFTSSTIAGTTHNISATTGGQTGSASVSTVVGQAARYNVMSSASSATVGTSVTITAQLADANGNPVSTSGQTVTWGSTNGGSFASPMSTTNGSGQATVSFTVSNTAGTSHVVSATTGVSITGSSSAITSVSAGASKYLVNASQSSVVAGTQVTITAQLADALGNPISIENEVVTWGSTNGGSFASPTSNTNASGVATVTFTTSTVAGTSHVVSATTGSNTGSAPAITTTAGTATKYLVTASTTSPFAGDAVTINAQLADANNNPVALSNESVTWSSNNGGSFASPTSITNASGIATIAFTTTASVGASYVVTATTGANNGSSPTITTLAPPAKYIVNATPASPVAGAAVTITAQLVDASDNPVSLSGVVVNWSKTGAGGSFASGSSTTNASGVATVSFTTSTTAGVAYTFTGTDGSSRTGTSGTVTTVAGLPAKYLVTSSSSNPIAGDAVTITAQLADANDNILTTSGEVVSWSASNGGSFASPTSTTNASGIATVSFTTNTVSGTGHVVTATTGSVTGNTTTITTIAGAATKYVVSVPASPVAGSPVTVSAQAADANGNPVPLSGQIVTWSKTGAGGSFSQPTSTTDANGLATVSFTTSTTAEVDYTFMATDGVRNGTSSTVTTVAGAATQLIVSASPASVAAGANVTVTAQLRDANNNPVKTAGVTINWSKAGDGGSFASATSQTDANGTATVSFTTDNTATIVYQFTGTGPGGLTGTSSDVLSVWSGLNTFSAAVTTTEARTVGY